MFLQTPCPQLLVSGHASAAQGSPEDGVGSRRHEGKTELEPNKLYLIGLNTRWDAQARHHEGTTEGGKVQKNLTQLFVRIIEK